MRVSVRTVALLLLLLTPWGCVVMIPGAIAGAGAGAYIARDIRVKVKAPIKVRFEPPRDATLIGRGGRDTTLLSGTSLLIGRVRDLRGDTLWVTVSEAYSGSAHRLRYDRRRAPEVVVVLEPGVRVEPLGNQAASMVTGGLLGAGVALGIVVVRCMLNSCFN